MIRCVIIDDEPLAIEILETYLTQISGIQLAGTFTNPIQALSFVQDNKTDLIFLDIEMPLFNGMDFIKTLSYKPVVIITTAYRDYAVESFEMEAIDYLVKPIPFHRFIKATNKAISLLSKDNKIQKTSIEEIDKTEGQTTDSDLWLKADKKFLRISMSDIIYIESLKDYIRIKTKDNELITYQTLTGIMEKLPAAKFVRIHKSFIVCIQKIDIVEGNMVRIADKILPVGRVFRQGLIDRINTASYE